MSNVCHSDLHRRYPRFTIDIQLEAFNCRRDLLACFMGLKTTH